MRNPRILVVMGPVLAAANDTSIAIIEEALDRGLRVDVCDSGDLVFDCEGVVAETRCVNSASVAGMACGAPARTPLRGYAAILYRKDPPFTVEELHATLLLEHARGHAVLVNDPRGLREANEKLFALRFPALTPPTAVLRERALIRSFCRAQGGTCVLKPVDGCGGSGVFVLRDADPNANVIIEVATDEGRRLVVVQAWLSAIHEGDKRIFLLDGEPIGALLRMPADGELRANLHRGATAHATTLSARERSIAAAVGGACRELGLNIVGLDVIGGHLIEVNVTSPTGFRELERLTGTRLQKRVVDWLMGDLATRASRNRVSSV